MKKYLYSIVVFLFAFMFFLPGVRADETLDEPLFYCEYGLPKEESSDPWTNSGIKGDIRTRIKIAVYRWDYYRVVGDSSYTVRSVYFDDNGLINGKAFVNLNYNESKQKNYIAWGEDVSNSESRYYYYVSLYPFETTYQILDGKCPATIKYKVLTEGGTWNRYHFMFYNDDLDKPAPNGAWWLKDHDDCPADECVSVVGLVTGKDPVASSCGLKASGTLVEKEHQDKPLSELVSDYGCNTYSAGLQAIKQSMNKVDPASCDNNVYFNQAYSELNTLCDRFKSSSLYSDDDGEAKACSKACTLLKDNVASICGKTPDQGSCGSLGARTVKWLFKVIRIVRYIVPALLIILSIIDYIKAIAADSDDEIKKVTTRVMKRLIAAALIFIIPFILEFILNFFDIPGLNNDNPFCAQ